MNSLIPVIAGLAVGVGFIVTFAIIFNQTASVAPTEYEKNLAQLISHYEPVCTDPKCVAEIVANCDNTRTAIIESGNNRVWIVGARNTSDYCHGYFNDLNILSIESHFGDSILYDCHISHEELPRLKESSFDMLLSNVKQDSGWRCGIAVP